MARSKVGYCSFVYELVNRYGLRGGDRLLTYLDHSYSLESLGMYKRGLDVYQDVNSCGQKHIAVVKDRPQDPNRLCHQRKSIDCVGTNECKDFVAVFQD